MEDGFFNFKEIQTQKVKRSKFRIVFQFQSATEKKEQKDSSLALTYSRSQKDDIIL